MYFCLNLFFFLGIYRWTFRLYFNHGYFRICQWREKSRGIKVCHYELDNNTKKQRYIDFSTSRVSYVFHMCFLLFLFPAQWGSGAQLMQGPILNPAENSLTLFFICRIDQVHKMFVPMNYHCQYIKKHCSTD